MKKEIAIFVSHRIDLPCETPKSPIYHPTRCGAVFDESLLSQIPGDDTGDNISHLRNSFCELTVEYWAWKNYKADYYGLCHYRRYFSFSDTLYRQDRFNVVERGTISSAASKYELENTKKITKIVQNYDAIIPTLVDIRTILTGVPGGDRFYPHDVKEFWQAKVDQIDYKCVETLVKIVKKKHPEMYPYIMQYLNGTTIYTGCCYIMKKELFFQLCEFQFSVLEEFQKEVDLTKYTGELMRQPGFMGEILYATFLFYLKDQKKKLKELQVVFFSRYQVGADITAQENVLPASIQENSEKKGALRESVKKLMKNIFPAYRVSQRMEERVNDLSNVSIRLEKKLSYLVKKMDSMQQVSKQEEVKPVKPIASSLTKKKWDSWTLTSSIDFNIACFAMEVHETHKASFAEFRDCNTGKDVVIVATGPSMRYYKQLPNAPHIGVNAAFKNENIKLDYYFTTDYESHNEWFAELKNYDFIKFFGQYSAGSYRDRFQVSEQLVKENHARRFFQGAPNEDININIEFYPLMGFYSIAFQAIHFATYTNPKRIFLVGCDCDSSGYFDGNKQLFANLPKWVKGYEKLKIFIEHFYPEMEVVSINPVGLKGLFKDVYTENYLEDHPEIDRNKCQILTPEFLAQ